MGVSIDYCLVNGIKHQLVDYLEMFDALTHEFWKSLDGFDSINILDDLTENQRMLDIIKTKWYSYRYVELLGSPYIFENNLTKIEIVFSDIIASITVSDVNHNILFKRKPTVFGFKEYNILCEMARLIGSPFSTLEFNRNNYRSGLFDVTKDWNKIGSIRPDMHVYHDDKDMYVVNDHANNQTVYLSKIERKESSPGFQHPHIEQSAVDRVKNTDRLPKGFATDFIYDHFNNQSLPLKSSGTQYTTGAAMWERLVNKALADGKHVYATSKDGIRQINDYNKEFVMSTTKSDKDPAYENKHIVISHHPIKESGNYE